MIECGLSRTLAEVLVPNCGDATMVMYQHRSAGQQFDVVDLDPYGACVRACSSAAQL